MAKLVLVKATATGFKGGRRYRSGQKFWVRDTELVRRNRSTGKPVLNKDGHQVPVSWYEPVKPPEPEIVEKEEAPAVEKQPAAVENPPTPAGGDDSGVQGLL